MTPQLLSDDEIASRLDSLNWSREGDEIVRDVTLENFGEAVILVDRVAEVAERHNHHPDILIHGWNKVRLSLTNHAAGGLTQVDFDMAARFDELIAR
jgi:4a-hydroxytetrahydrobiopterin dehydratase